MFEENDSFTIAESQAGQRLDKILASQFSNVKSRSYFHYLFQEGKIKVNGAVAKKRHQPKVFDEVDIEWICTPKLNLIPEDIPLEVLFEDEHIIVVNKPAGMVVHPATGNWSNTFVNALLFHCQNLKNEFSASEELRPGIVHRLDKDTTGLLVAAKTVSAHKCLVQLFANREIEKKYLAVCIGSPGNGTIDLPIARHPTKRKEMAICQERGKRAVTICKTLAHNERCSLVSLKLVTGRTHQLRVHLKAKGAPILGDPVYGSEGVNRKYALEHQMLHAHELSFSHPITGVTMNFKAPVPLKMRQLILRENFQHVIFL